MPVCLAQTDVGALAGGGLFGIVVLGVAIYFARRDQVIGSLNAEVRRLQDRVTREEGRVESLQQRLDGQQKQIIHLQTWSKDFPFASWAADREYRILNVTGNADRNVLYPMGLDRTKVELHKEDDIWPPRLVAVLKHLRESAQKKPGHIAAMRGVKIHPDLPRMDIAKILGQSPDGSAWGVQTILIPETAIIQTPAEFTVDPVVAEAPTPDPANYETPPVVKEP